MTTEFLFFISLILLLLYGGQILLAIINAYLKPSSEESSILQRLFSGTDNITSTWITFGIIFTIPVLVSWMSAMSDYFLSLDNNFAIFTACTSMLLVLITLELSQLNDINYRNRNPWRGLLLFALSLDILSLLFLNIAIKQYATASDVARWSEVVDFVVRIGFAAFIASFAVILFARKAGELGDS